MEQGYKADLMPYSDRTEKLVVPATELRLRA
jgi:hypothetical protein